MPPPCSEATRLLRAEAADELLPRVYDELRAIAAAYLRRNRRDHTLQPTALVNEAWMKLIDHTAVVDGDRERFLAVGARAMRQVLVDHARRRGRVKRGGGAWNRVTLDHAVAPQGCAELDLVELDDALARLAQKSERMARVVELRFFGGLTIDETASVLGVSDRTVDAAWFAARGWLARELGGAGNEGAG